MHNSLPINNLFKLWKTCGVLFSKFLTNCNQMGYNIFMFPQIIKITS